MDLHCLQAFLFVTFCAWTILSRDQSGTSLEKTLHSRHKLNVDGQHPGNAGSSVNTCVKSNEQEMSVVPK